METPINQTFHIFRASKSEINELNKFVARTCTVGKSVDQPVRYT